MRLLSSERINGMSELEKLKMIDNIKTSNLTLKEKDENLALLQPSFEKQQQVLRELEESKADISDLQYS